MRFRSAIIVASVLVLGGSAKGAEVTGLRARTYDRGTGRLKTELRAARATHEDGRFRLMPTRTGPRITFDHYSGDGSRLRVTAARADYVDGEAALSGGVDLEYTAPSADGKDETKGDHARFGAGDMIWRQAGGWIETKSPVRGSFSSGGAEALSIEGVGLDMDTAGRVARLGGSSKIVLHGRGGLVGGLTAGPDRRGAEGKDRTTTVASSGPVEIALPAAKGDAIVARMSEGVEVTEMSGVLLCGGLIIEFGPSKPVAGGPEVAGGYRVDYAEATGGVEMSAGDVLAAADRAEYVGALDTMLLAGGEEAEAVLSGGGKVLSAASIVIDRRNGSVQTGGSRRTRLRLDPPAEGKAGAE